MLLTNVVMIIAMTTIVNAKCVDIKYDIDVSKTITDYNTYYTTLSTGDIVMQIKTSVSSFSFPKLQVIPDSGDITAFDSEYIYDGQKTTLASKVKANLKFRLQFQVDAVPSSTTESTLGGTLCYPTDTTPTVTETSNESTTNNDPTTVSDPTTSTITDLPTITDSTTDSTGSDTKTESSNTGKIVGIIAGIIAALLSAGGLTYLCKNPTFKCFSSDTTHIHNNGENANDNFVNIP